MPPQSPASLTEQLLEGITGSWKSQAISAAARLGLADLLASHAMTVDELAKNTKTHAPSLRRLLNALMTLGICSQVEGDAYAITPLGALLGTDAPGGARFWAIWWGTQLWPVWGNLLYSVQTGKSARTLLSGTEGFAHLERDSEAASIFNQALAELTRLMSDNLLRLYDFSGVNTLADVGGGSGQLLVSILKAHPEMSGILIELSHARGPSEARFANSGIDARCKFIAGDFFVAVERGADAYLLKSVIHDWDDARSGQILNNCRRAMGARGRLLLIEQMLPDRLETVPEHQSLVRSDLNMLVTLGACERTEGELRGLVEAAGFSVARILPLGATFTLIEAFPNG